MKHTISVTMLLVLLFVAAQFVGLLLISRDISVAITPEGVPVVVHSEPVVGPRPEISGADSVLMVMASVGAGTALLLTLIRFGKMRLWKLLFFWAAFMSISIALGVVMEPLLAFGAGFALAALKLLRPHVVIHNLTEILMYAGIAVLFVPLFQLEWMIVLLLVISVYDMVAVWKSKHMITLATSLTESKAFAGLSVSYATASRGDRRPGSGNAEAREAILGGGDIAFPLLFSGVVMEFLITSMNMAADAAFFRTLIITLCVTLTLIALLAKGEAGKFYPAMPFLTAGALAGLGIVLAI